MWRNFTLQVDVKQKLIDTRCCQITANTGNVGKQNAALPNVVHKTGYAQNEYSKCAVVNNEFLE